METLWQDLRYAARSLLRQPGFTLIVVLTLAVGMGANSAIFVVHATMLRPFAFKEPDRLMTIALTTPAVQGNPPRDDVVWSYPKFRTFRELQQVFEDVAVYRSRTFNLTGVEEAERLPVEVAGASQLFLNPWSRGGIGEDVYARRGPTRIAPRSNPGSWFVGPCLRRRSQDSR